MPALLPVLLLHACQRQAPPSLSTPPSPAEAGQSLRLLEGAPSRLAGSGTFDPGRFAAACPALLSRPDPSGLTRPDDWAPACTEARPGAAPGPFLDRHFRVVRRGDGRGLVTGYYVPAIPASPVARPGLVPVLGPPEGLACTQSTPCPPRAAIEAGALAGRSPILAWADPVDLFFMQVQGSGVLRLPDGRVQKLGFAGSNGQPYVAIGARLRSRGDIPAGAGMAGIRAWLAAHPEAIGPTLAENPRYVFFRAVAPDAPFPVGALGIGLRARRDAAVDPALVPPGALLHLTTRIGDAAFAGLVLASDRGAAIRGPNRVDLYMGEGDAAGAAAGTQQAPGDVLLLLPQAAAGRLVP